MKFEGGKMRRKGLRTKKLGKEEETIVKKKRMTIGDMTE